MDSAVVLVAVAAAAAAAVVVVVVVVVVVALIPLSSSPFWPQKVHPLVKARKTPFD
jgi:hypothetical protein